MNDAPEHNLREDAQRYLVEALQTVADAWVAEHPRPPEPEGDEEDAAYIAYKYWYDPPWLEIYDLVENYDPPKPNNLAEIRNELRGSDCPHPTNDDAKEDLIYKAAYLVNAQNGGRRAANKADPITRVVEAVVEEQEGSFRLVQGVDVDALKLGDEPLIRKPVLAPLEGNIRTPNPDGYKELREAMETFGWLPELPAIADEHGAIIVGNRRIAVADELGIEPVIKTISFGDDDPGNAHRWQLALASNLGAEKISPADRKAIAERMYGAGWRMDKIAETLRVATMTISRDLRGFNTVLNPERGGRPRKESEPAPQPAEPASEPVARPIDPDEDARISRLLLLNEPEPEAKPVDPEYAAVDKSVGGGVLAEAMTALDLATEGDDPNAWINAHEACRVLMTLQSCGPRCALIHAVVTRDGDRIKTTSYPAETPVAFWPGTPDKYVDRGLRLRVGTPPRPRYARTREEEFALGYPHRSVWGGVMAVERWDRPTILNQPFDPWHGVRPTTESSSPVPPSSSLLDETADGVMPVPASAAR